MNIEKYGLPAHEGLKLLYWDIETTYLMGPAWPEDRDRKLLWVEQDWFMLSFSYMWEHEGKPHTVILPDFPGYKKNKLDDTKLMKEAYKVLDAANVKVGHNGDKFDWRKANARMIINGVPPPSPSINVDTLKIARKFFSFTSNKLDDLGEQLGVGRKRKISDKRALWKGCIDGDMKCWEEMRKYNRQDVILLSKVYKKLAPWAESLHHNMAVIEGRPDVCSRCGLNDGFKSKGFRYTQSGRKRIWLCKHCGFHNTERAMIRETRSNYK